MKGSPVRVRASALAIRGLERGGLNEMGQQVKRPGYGRGAGLSAVSRLGSRSEGRVDEGGTAGDVVLRLPDGTRLLVRLEDAPWAVTQLDPANPPQWAEAVGDGG